MASSKKLFLCLKCFMLLERNQDRTVIRTKHRAKSKPVLLDFVVQHNAALKMWLLQSEKIAQGDDYLISTKQLPTRGDGQDLY